MLNYAGPALPVQNLFGSPGKWSPNVGQIVLPLVTPTKAPQIEGASYGESVLFRSIDVLGGVVVGTILSSITSLIIPGLRSPREIGLSKLAIGMGLGVVGTLNPVQGSVWAILPFVGGLMAGRGIADQIFPGKGWTWYKKK